jgi:circadian clock protein KaiB
MAFVGAETQLLLKLFVAGSSNRTAQAIANLTRICDDEFPGGYQLAVTDVLEQPAIAEEKKFSPYPP